MQSNHKPGLNAPSYSNQEGVTCSFEKDVNGRMLCVMRTYSMKAAYVAKAAPDLLATFQKVYDLLEAGKIPHNHVMEEMVAVIAKATR